MTQTLATLLLALIPTIAVVAAPRRDALTLIMLALVTFIAWIIHRYARRYLDGQAHAHVYRRWFVLTVAASSLLVSTGDLRVLAAAWTASSLSLHQLLTFFANRPQAQIAAHKKFLMSRLADVAIYAAVYLIGRAAGSYDLGTIAVWAGEVPALPNILHVAGGLLVSGVALRSAQLPFHGWLIQVMEAPTPVSALLHAGVVNIGGFVLIRLAPLMVRLPEAQLALVVIGATTAVLAALAARTRIGVKVALAWSTAAQMGFMLVECGLGAWDFALLHLVAHSCYKAHAFLRSGGAVAEHVRRQRALSPSIALTGLAFAALALLLVTEHRLLSLVSVTSAVQPVQPAALIVVIVASVVLVLMQVLLAARPEGALARALFPWAFAGFYLDAVFTRATFLIWPPRSPSSRSVWQSLTHTLTRSTMRTSTSSTSLRSNS